MAVEDLSHWMQKHWEEADFIAYQPSYEEPKTTTMDIGGFVTAEIIPDVRCIHWEQRASAWPYEQCENIAGQGTDHYGAGLCNKHGGNISSGRIRGIILMAHAYGEELDTTPWDALLQQVRMLAGQVAWLQARVVKSEKDLGEASIRPGGESWDLVAMLEARGERLAKTAKMAIDAGVAERMVATIQLEGEMMFRAAMAMMDALGIEDEDKRESALAVMSGKLLELEAEQK